MAVAFDKDTGKELWRALIGRRARLRPADDLRGRRQAAAHHLAPGGGQRPRPGDRQALLVECRSRSKAALAVPTPRLAGDLLFVTAFYNGSLMLKLDEDKPDAEVLWKGKSNSEQPEQTDGLHSIMPTPVIKDGHIYGVCSYGELRCLKADTGERVWETRAGDHGRQGRSAGATPSSCRTGDRFFLFNEKGDLIIAR